MAAAKRPGRQSRSPPGAPLKEGKYGSSFVVKTRFIARPQFVTAPQAALTTFATQAEFNPKFLAEWRPGARSFKAHVALVQANAQKN